MILSPYHNPPYRPPMPKKSSSSSSPDRSPKRKRNLGFDSPRFHTSNLAEAPRGTMPESSSPRLQVADKLNELSIKTARVSINQSPVKRKRVKRIDSPKELCIAETPEPSRNAAQGTSSSSSTIGAEKAYEQPSSSQQPIFHSTLPLVTGTPPRTPSPTSSTSIQTQDAPPRSLSPLPAREALTPDQAALTWQEDEITGHEIDSAADDDGEGINGIGFRPTPAMAHARHLKRKQQVHEYKAREAKDARQKRMDRRRGAQAFSIEKELFVGGEMKRMVRFVGVG